MKSRLHHTSAASGSGSIAVLLRSALAVGAILSCGVAAAAAADTSKAQARYQEERAICMNGQSHQDRATCLREAGAALNEAKRGNLGEAPQHYERNQMMRCEVHVDGERDDCMRRMRGEGTVSGSVKGGGIYRELRTTVPAK